MLYAGPDLVGTLRLPTGLCPIQNVDGGGATTIRLLAFVPVLEQLTGFWEIHIHIPFSAIGGIGFEQGSYTNQSALITGKF